jgi:hypothetical protein
MLRLVGSLPKSIYCPRIYVAAATDALSGQKAMEAEKTYQADVGRIQYSISEHQHQHTHTHPLIQAVHRLCTCVHFMSYQAALAALGCLYAG